MANTGTVIILATGTITFANEWYQDKVIDWKVPVATLIGAAVIDGVSLLDSKAATLFSVLILIGAVTTKFNGHSIADTVSELLAQPPKKTGKK